MAVILKCDICGCVYNKYKDDNRENGIAFVNRECYEQGISGCRKYRILDTCPQCLKNIKEIIEVLAKSKGNYDYSEK
jgi:hypothetical protein